MHLHTPYPMTAEQAETATKLQSREVYRPAEETESGFNIYPRNPNLRYQLGKFYAEKRHQPPIDGIRDAFIGDVDVFELVAYGRTWADAVADWRAKQ